MELKGNGIAFDMRRDLSRLAAESLTVERSDTRPSASLPGTPDLD